MQTTRLTQHGIWLRRKHRSVGNMEHGYAEKNSLGNTWDGFIMLVHRHFKAHVLSHVKMQGLSYKI